MLKSNSLRIAIYIFIFSSFGLLMWKDFIFNARMDEHTKEMARSLDYAKMPINQNQIISDSLTKIKNDVSSYGNDLSNYLLLSYNIRINVKNTKERKSLKT